MLLSSGTEVANIANCTFLIRQLDYHLPENSPWSLKNTRILYIIYLSIKQILRILEIKVIEASAEAERNVLHGRTVFGRLGRPIAEEPRKPC